MPVGDATAKARAHVETAWYRFMGDRNLKAKVSDWRTHTAGDGDDLLSVEVVGQGAAHALGQFIAWGPIGLPRPGDTRPAVDYSVPGRVAYVWRSFGVWVELWHPDKVLAAPGPVQGVPEADPALVSASSRRPFLGPGGRLTFTRNRRLKEARTA